VAVVWALDLWRTGAILAQLLALFSPLAAQQNRSRLMARNGSLATLHIDLGLDIQNVLEYNVYSHPKRFGQDIGGQV
jgi:hypothetical protein